MKEILRKGTFFALVVLALVIVEWQCPIQTITGYPCPGCMMTTAAYYLIQLDFVTAFAFNPAIYVLMIGGILALVNRKNKTILRWIGWIVLLLWFLIYVFRMITIFPEWPMPYVEDNYLNQIMKIMK